MRAGVVAVQADHPVRLLKGPVRPRLVADLPAIAHVVREPLPGEGAPQVRLVVPDDGGPRGDGLLRVHNRRQNLVVDLDGLAGILGDIGVVGDDAGDLLALEAHLVGRQHRLGVVGKGRHPREVVLGGHLPGDHEVHPRGHPCPGGVDGPDSGVGNRAAQYLHVQHPRQLEVVEIVALAPDEPGVLHPLAPGAEAPDRDLVIPLRRPEGADAHLVNGHVPTSPSWRTGAGRSTALPHRFRLQPAMAAGWFRHF